MAKAPDLLVPWKVVVMSYKHHILMTAVKAGKTPAEAAEIYGRLLNNEPDEEMIALVKSLVAETARNL